MKLLIQISFQHLDCASVVFNGYTRKALPALSLPLFPSGIQLSRNKQSHLWTTIARSFQNWSVMRPNPTVYVYHLIKELQPLLSTRVLVIQKRLKSVKNSPFNLFFSKDCSFELQWQKSVCTKFLWVASLFWGLCLQPLQPTPSLGRLDLRSLVRKAAPWYFCRYPGHGHGHHHLQSYLIPVQHLLYGTQQKKRDLTRIKFHQTEQGLSWASLHSKGGVRGSTCRRNTKWM